MHASSDICMSIYLYLYTLSRHSQRVKYNRMHAHRLSVIALPTRRIFSSVRQAVDPKKPVLGMRLKSSPLAFKFISGRTNLSPCRCTPMHFGADSKKFSFSIKIHLCTSNGSVDTKTVLRTVLTVVALEPTDKPKP